VRVHLKGVLVLLTALAFFALAINPRVGVLAVIAAFVVDEASVILQLVGFGPRHPSDSR
jgi:hypothetical protein